MNLLAAQQLDDGLADLAEADPVAGELRILAEHAEDVSLLGIGIHAEQEVSGRQMEV